VERECCSVSLRSGKNRAPADFVGSMCRARDPASQPQPLPRWLADNSKGATYRCFGHGGGVLLEGHQIIERVDRLSYSVDEAHVNVADSGPVQGFKAQRIFPMEDRHFESALATLLSNGAPAPQETS